MGAFKLGTMTLKGLFKKPETIMYPAQTRFAPEGLKGHIENNMDTCILCSICQKKCPTGSLTVDKDAGTWTYNPFRCIQCGFCVAECPKDSLSMEPTYTTPTGTKELRVCTKSDGTAEKDPANA